MLDKLVKRVNKVLFYAVLAGIFVFLFLAVFQPFGIARFSLAQILGYGVITLLLSFAFTKSKTIKIRHKKRFKHNTIKEILFHDISFLVILGFLNLIYTAIIDPNTYLSLHSIFIFQFYTITIGILVFVIIRFVQMQVEATRRATEDKIELQGDGIKEKLIFESIDFIYAKVDGNYCNVYLEKNNKLVKRTLRITLSEILYNTMDYSFIKQCHRSYAINTLKIKSLKSNLLILYPNTEIPLSRNYKHAIQEQYFKMI